MDRDRALAKAAFGKSSSRYSNRNVDTRSRVTKDRKWRIAAKIATKIFYLVSSSDNHVFSFAAANLRDGAKQQLKLHSTKLQLQLQLLQCQGGWNWLIVHVLAFDAF
jgi:hypothetical protein